MCSEHKFLQIKLWLEIILLGMLKLLRRFYIIYMEKLFAVSIENADWVLDPSIYLSNLFTYLPSVIYVVLFS